MREANMLSDSIEGLPNLKELIWALRVTALYSSGNYDKACDLRNNPPDHCLKKEKNES